MREWVEAFVGGAFVTAGFGAVAMILVALAV